MISLAKLNDTHTEQAAHRGLPAHQDGIRRNDLNILHSQMIIMAIRGHIGLWLPAMIDDDGEILADATIMTPDHSGCTRNHCPSA